MSKQTVNIAKKKIEDKLERISLGRFSPYYKNVEKEINKQLVEVYKTAAKEINNKLALDFAKYGKQYKDFATYNRLNNMLYFINKELKKLNARTVKTIEKGLTDIYSIEFSYQAYLTEQLFGVSTLFGLINPKTVKRAIENQFEFVKWQSSLKVNKDKIFNHLKNEITQGLVQGKGYKATAREINKRLGLIKYGKELKPANKGDLYSVFRIVWTESNRVRNQSLFDYEQATKGTYKRLGIKRDKIWRATLDVHTRPSHAQLDGQKADKNGFFHIGNLKALYPNGFGVPAEDINCRCAVVFKPNVFKFNNIRLDNITKTKVSTDNFLEWAKQKGIKKNIYNKSYFKTKKEPISR